MGIQSVGWTIEKQNSSIWRHDGYILVRPVSASSFGADEPGYGKESFIQMPRLWEYACENPQAKVGPAEDQETKAGSIMMVIKVGGVEFPGHGAPCNGCGLCCLSALCIVASAVFVGQDETKDEFEGPCPALERDGDRYYCGFMRSPAQYRPVEAAIHGEAALIAAMKFMMGSGEGCDLELEGHKLDAGHMRRMDARAITMRGAYQHAAMIWGF